MAVQRSQIAVGIAVAAVVVGYVALRPGSRAGMKPAPAPVAEVVGEAGVKERPVQVRPAPVVPYVEERRVEPVRFTRKILPVRPPTGVAATSGPAVTVAEVPQEPEVIEPDVPLPVAREALALAGADPDATLVWAAAINDPTLSPHDRSDLIEDLNEVGIDPKNLTPDDLPLIVNRLAMIEELAPDAMDQTNLDAFAEAYKDLSNMYARVTGQP